MIGLGGDGIRLRMEMKEMNYYLHLIEQGQIKAAEAWLDMYNRLVYFQLKPRDGEIEAAKLLKGLKYG